MTLSITAPAGATAERSASVTVVFEDGGAEPDTLHVYVKNRTSTPELAYQFVTGEPAWVASGYSVQFTAPGTFVVRSAIGWVLDELTVSAVSVRGVEELTAETTWTLLGESPDWDPVTDITEEGQGWLLEQFHSSPKINALLKTYLDQIQDVETTAYLLTRARDINTATGDRLDGLGQILNIGRLGLSDADYRVRLRAEVAILRSRGTVEDMILVLRLLLNLSDPPSIDVHSYFPKTLYMRAVDRPLVEENPRQVASALRRAISAATQLLFLYSIEGDANTYTLSSQPANLDTNDSSRGLTSIVWFADWNYESNGRTLSGLLPGEFRFNTPTPETATQIFVHATNAASQDTSFVLQTLTNGQTLSIHDHTSLGATFAVTGVTDHTGTFTLDVTLRSSQASFGDYDTLQWLVLTAAGGGALSGAA